MSDLSLRLTKIWRNPLPIDPYDQVRRALTVVAKLLALGGAKQLRYLIARRLLRGGHELQADEMGCFWRQNDIPTGVVPGDQQFSQFLFVAPDTRHVPYLFARRQESSQ